MNSAFAADAALDFASREQARTRAFSEVWNGRLEAVFADVAPYYDVASNVASLGLCDHWRRRFLDRIAVKAGDRLLDVCAGTNAIGINLMSRQRDLEVTAIDRSTAMQRVGRQLARARGLHIESIIGDAHHLPFPEDYFDVVTLQYASRHLRVVDVFSEVRRVLRPGGAFYHCDMLRPENKAIEALYSVYLKACVSTTARLFGSGPEARSCTDYFVRAIQMFYSARELSDLMGHVGFTNVAASTAVGGVVGMHRAVKA